MGIVGLYVGRFQPFHLGHLEVVRSILNRADELIIAIGSSQYSHTRRNPFTAGERVTMIRESLRDANMPMHRVQITPVPDINVHKIWVAHVSSYVGRFDVVYSNDPLTSYLFREAGVKVEPIPFYRREVYSATEIRRRILEGGNWRELLPEAVCRVIDSVDGVERIRMLYQTDNP
ncbi:MAG: nicotinamide-nucleotide adenylyltransferase [Candidatus Bathyarchaeia archaeon]